MGSNLRNILLAIGLVMGFTFIILFFILMIREQYGISCSCKVSLTIIMAVLASLGVFVGRLGYKNELINNIYEKRLSAGYTLISHNRKFVLMDELKNSKIHTAVSIDVVNKYLPESTIVFFL